MSDDSDPDFEFAGELAREVPREHVHVDRDGERFVEGFVPAVGGSRLVACAPHGGGIEPATDRQALALADRFDGAGAWACAGDVEGDSAFDRWHVTSTELDRASFAFLGEVLDAGFEHAVAFHGLAPGGDERVLIGGAVDRDLREAARAAIDDRLDCPVRIVESGDYAGVDPDNVVNRAARRDGLQIEQTPGVRDDRADGVVDAVAEVLNARL